MSASADLNARNASFWNELCGTEFARNLGITDQTPESLRRFDEAYFDFYPYLKGYVTREPLAGKDVMEIGLGYGTLGQFIAGQGCRYVGVDISPGPVGMMKSRLERTLPGGNWAVQRGSARALPFADRSFDYVYSIGCLHHTGDVRGAVSEVGRVLRPGGKAIVMLYNRHSFQVFYWTLRAWLGARDRMAEAVRYRFDHNSAGDAAPHTDFSSRRDVRRMFASFAKVKIDTRNFENYSVRRIPWLQLKRAWTMGTVGRVIGSDLYIVATR